jgi:prepilin-type N-terminal cleavage/methylation domain-containing protein
MPKLKPLLAQNQTTNPQAGFTFLELIISVAIVTVIITGVFLLQDFFYKQQQETIDNYVSVDIANRNIERMIREIRNSRIADNGAYTLEILGDQELAFYCNIDNDPQIERVHYYLNGSVLYRGITEPTSHPITYPAQNEKVTPVAQDISNNVTPIFYYYNGSWPSDTANNPLAANQRATQTRTIGISLYLYNQNKGQQTQYQIQSSAQIRTLKDNL